MMMVKPVVCSAQEVNDISLACRQLNCKAYILDVRTFHCNADLQYPHLCCGRPTSGCKEIQCWDQRPTQKGVWSEVASVSSVTIRVRWFAPRTSHKVKKGSKVVQPFDVWTSWMWRACSLYHVPTRNHNEAGHIQTQADDCSEETWIMFVEAADQMLLVGACVKYMAEQTSPSVRRVWWQDQTSKEADEASLLG